MDGVGECSSAGANDKQQEGEGTKPLKTVMVLAATNRP